MENYDLFLPSYFICNDVYGKIKDICLEYGEKAVVIGGHKGMNAAKDKLIKAAEEAKIEILDFVWFGNDCTYDNVSLLSENDAVKKCDYIFAVGGGKALDTCKCLGQKINKKVFTFPTIASNCAACTTVSIMYNNDGTFKEPYFFLRPAVHTFIDTEILTNAPEKYMWAGIGDTYSKYYESTISAREEELEHFKSLGVGMSHMCLHPLIIYGEKALEDNEKKICSYELEQTALVIIVTTAIVSIFLTRDHTPDYNSGLAHAVFYALTQFEEIEKNHLHGEVVAFGVLILLLCDNAIRDFEKIYEFNKKIGLPVKLQDIGISREQFNEIIDKIPEMSDVKHYPYKVTASMLENALKVLEKKNI